MITEKDIIKKIEKLKIKLNKLKDDNRSAWDTYGSELCAGEMIREETKIEKEIEDLEFELDDMKYINKEDPKYIIDD